MTENINVIKSIVNQYGLPIVAAGGMGYFIYYIWKFVTENIHKELNSSKKTMVELIDKIRMLDNDMIRLEQKINTAVEIQRNSQLSENSKTDTRRIRPSNADSGISHSIP